MAPGELLGDQALGQQRLHGLDDMQIGNGLQLGVLGGVEVLLRHHHSLLEQILIDLVAVLLWHKHPVDPVEVSSSDKAIIGWMGSGRKHDISFDDSQHNHSGHNNKHRSVSPIDNPCKQRSRAH